MNPIDNLRVVIGDGGKVLKSNYPYVRATVVISPNYGSPVLALAPTTGGGYTLGIELLGAGFKDGDKVLILRVPPSTEEVACPQTGSMETHGPDETNDDPARPE